MALTLPKDTVWDGTCAEWCWGSTRVATTMVKTPDVEVATKEVAVLGEPLASRRTVGFAKIGEFEIEMVLNDYESFVMPIMNEHAFTEHGFAMTGRVAHPGITGSFEVLLDRCRVVKWPGMEFKAGTEDQIIKKLGCVCHGYYERGRDGIWKTLPRVTGKPSRLAQVLMQL